MKLFLIFIKCNLIFILNLYANDSIKLPKSFKLEFFELSNKLTAKHKRQLNKALYLINKFKNYEVVITAGLEKSKSKYIVYDKRIDNTLTYLKHEVKNIKEFYYDYGLNEELNNHVVEISFKKLKFDTFPYFIHFEVDSISLHSIQFLPNSCFISFERALFLDQIVDEVKNIKSMEINLTGGGGSSSYQPFRIANCRMHSIIIFLQNKMRGKKIKFISTKDDNIDENSVDIAIFKKE